MDISAFRTCRARAIFAAVLVAGLAFGLPAHADTLAPTPTRTSDNSALLPLPAGVPESSRRSSFESAHALTSTSMDLAAAGAWLLGQQVTSGATAGAFPWTPNDPNVYTNTQGATALSLLRVYGFTGNAALLNAAIANGQCQINECIPNWTYSDGSHRFATHDPLFLDELSAISGDPQYANFVTANFWDRLQAGTYGSTQDFDATEWATYVLTARTGQGYPELVAWDLSKAAIAAHKAGKTATAQAIMGAIQASINAADATHTTFDVVGLAGGILASNITGVNLTATSGTWSGATSTADLAALLAGYQTPGGGFIGSTALALTDANADSQTTAYALRALASTNRGAYISAILDAANFEASLQQPSGEILAYPGAPANSAGNVENHGESIEAFADAAAGVGRWVNAVGGVDNGDCSLQTNPCASIAYAISQASAGNTIHIASATYYLPANTYLQIGSGLDGLRLVGDTGGSKPVITRQGGGRNFPLLVVYNPNAGHVLTDVHIENLQFNMDQSFVAEGILASGFVDGLTIDNNHFVDSRSTSAQNASFGYRNAISINDVRNSLSLGRTNGSSVTITNNVIDGIDAGNPTQVFLRAGVNMDAGVGTIAGNTITAGTHDIHVRFATTTTESSQDDILIDGNTLNGRGLEFDSPNASVGQITISNNQIHAIAGTDGVTAYPADWSLVRLIHNGVGASTTVSGNTFSGYTGAYRGVLIENYPGITLTGNTFTPANGATSFRSLVVSNKGITTVDPAVAPHAMTLIATGNTFDGSGVANAGMAVEFLNDNDAGDTATFGSLIFGGSGMGEANQFDGDLRWYFHLDDYDCETVTASGTHPVCATPPLPDYAGAIGSHGNSDVRPFTGNVSAANNLFAGAAPSTTTQNALLARTYDSAANSALGNVEYGLTATQLTTYVDDDFASASYGDPLTFTFNGAATGCASTTVYFGINAFATIPDGVNHVLDDGTVCIAQGSYTDAVTLTRPKMGIIGDGNGSSGTVITAPVVINTHNAGSPGLLLKDLRISSTAGVGVRVDAASQLAFDGVAFVGNDSHGLEFQSTADHIYFIDSIFDGNGGFGIRTATTAVVSDVEISGTTFQNNIGGILLFGGSASGAGQITDWSVDNSQFLSNDSANVTGWGGGIWIKTGGAGSAINGFTVTGSTFADNGSSSTLNRTGITIRARPNTTMTGVSICNNTFTENAGTPGTQLTGINVFDDAGNTGYSPVEVCASNTFTGVVHSVSGLEQFTLRGTQPVVNITGGSIANTEYINGLVTRVRDSAKFATISAALSDAGTVDNDEIDVPAGIYRENVTINDNGITLKGAGAGTIIDGTSLSGSGVTISNGETGTTLQDFTVQNFTAIGTSAGACVYGALSNNDTTIKNLDVSSCAGGRGGIFLNGPVDNVTIDNNDVSNTDGRGIVIWNGFKTNITITNNHVHDMSGCCGIELQDGTASGVTVTGNTVENVGDSGMAFIGLTSGAGPNLIDNNTITNTGRFGIALKLPNGSGAESGDGSIVVSNNVVTRLATPTSTDLRDVGGIVLVRRGYCSTCGETDVTTGVVVRDNTVDGWAQSSSNDGFGIVVEGTNSHVYGNTVSGSDIGIQLQAGNDGYPGDSDQAATNAFFSRGNTPTTCIDLGDNTFTGNTTDLRSVTADTNGDPLVGAVNLSGGIHNGSAYYCSINAAIAAASEDDTITVDAGTYPENVLVTKSVTLDGPKAGTAGYDDSRDGTGEAIISPATGRAVNVLASNVTFAGFTIANVNDNAIVSGGNYTGSGLGGPFDSVSIVDNRILNVSNGSGIYTNGPYPAVSGWTIKDNLFSNIASSGTSGINYWKADGGTISGNQIETIGFAGIQMVGSQGVSVTGNTISGTAHSGINVGGVAGVNSDGITISGNTLTDTNTSNNSLEGGLTLSAGASNVSFACNSVTGSGANGFVAGTDASNASGIKVFDNAFGVVSDIGNNASSDLAIGSNWYGGVGVAASVGGSNEAGVSVADPLSASPIGNVACGDNTPTRLVAVSGGGQTAAIGGTFGQHLVVRVSDALGGAVAGAAVTFTPPASGPSASLASGSTNFNGEFSAAATANGTAGGPYKVSATSGSLTPVNFALTNGMGTSAVVFDTPLSFTYNGNPHALSAHLQAEPSTSCSVSPASVTNAGSTTVTVTNCVGVNYSGSGSAKVTVAKATGTVVFDPLTYMADGSGVGIAQTPTVHIAEEPGTTCNVTTPASVTNAGSYAASATCDGQNYTASGTGVVTVAKAVASVTFYGPDLNQTYGDTHPVSASSHNPSGLDVDVTYDGSAYSGLQSNPGTYSVLATVVDDNYTGSDTAILTVSEDSQVSLSLSGPTMALVGASASYTDQVDYVGEFRNTGPATSQNTHLKFTVVRIDDGNGSGGQPIAIDVADVQLCVDDHAQWLAQTEHNNCPTDYLSLADSEVTGGSLNGRPAVTFRYPLDPLDDVPTPASAASVPLPAGLKAQFKAGQYQIQVDVVGDTDGKIYASTSTTTATTTVPEAAISYSGPSTGEAEDSLLSTTTLTNTGGRVDGKVIVRITLSDATATDTSPVLLAGIDAELAYQLGANYATLTWDATPAANGGLVTYFGPGTGFDLEDGHNATTAGRGIFHREGSYHLLYEVVDVVTGTVYASIQKTITIGPNSVSFTLSDLSQTYDTTPRAISVAPVGILHTTVYEPLGSNASCPASPTSGSATAPTDAGSYCVYVDASAPYSGSASGLLVVAKANAAVTIDGATSGVVTRIYDGSEQTVTATTPVTLSGSIEVRYNGNSTAPMPAGTYALTATINDPNYEGSANASLMVATASLTAIKLDDNDGTDDGVIHRSFTGAAQAVTAITTPSISYAVTYLGDGGTSYPLTTTPPSAAGSYHVVASTTDPNYKPLTASGTLVIEAIDVTVDSTGDTVGAVTVGGTPLYSLSATTTHINGAAPSENVLAHVLISHVGGAQLSDLDIEYFAATKESANCVAATLTGFWCPLPLTDNGDGTLGASFGPPSSGFPLTDGATSQFRTAYHRGGQYQVAVSLDGVTTGTSYVSSLGATNVAELHLTQAAPTSAGTGASVDSSFTLTNTGTAAISSASGTPDNENVLGQVEIGFDAGRALATGDLTVSYFEPLNNQYHVLLLTPCNKTKLCADFGPGSGFPVAAGYTATSLFRTTFVTDANYTVTVRAVGATSGALFAQNTQTIAVSQTTASITLDVSALSQVYGATHAVTATTSPAGLAYSVTYGINNSTSLPTGAGDFDVEATITEPGYSGSVTGTLHIAKAPATVSLSNLVQTYSGSAKSVTVTTDPSGLNTSVVYNPAPPTAAGSYGVVATVTDANYSGSASGTLIINRDAGTVAFSALSGTYGSMHTVIATLQETDTNATCSAVGGVPDQTAAVGDYLISATCSSDNYTASGTATYQVTGSGVSVFPVSAASVGVVTLVPLPDAAAKMSYYTFGSNDASGTHTVKAAFTVASSNPAAQAGDLDAQRLFDSGANIWKPLSITFDPNTRSWSGTFGPSAGFPPGAPNSNFRAAFHRGGSYTITVRLTDAASGIVLATSTPVVTDVAEIDLSGSGNTAGVIGEPVDTSYAVTNNGTASLSSGQPLGNPIPLQPAPNDENVRGQFVIDGPQDLTGASTNSCGDPSCASPDVEVEFFDPQAQAYVHIYNLQEDANHNLVGHFGALANGGVPMPAGYSGTYLFRTTYKTFTGTYTVKSQIIGLDTDTVYAETSQTVGVDFGAGASITVFWGDAGQATVGGNAYDQGNLTVQVLDSGGNPVQGAAVAFNVVSNASGAGVTPASAASVAPTDVNGETHITALSNNVAGAFEVNAKLSSGVSLSAPFGLINVADTDPTQMQLVLVSGDAQTAPVNAAYALPLTARVTDSFGNPVPATSVAFTAQGSGAGVTPSPAVGVSDVNGLVDSGMLTANGAAGAFTVDAVIAPASCTSANCTVSYQLTNTAGGAASVTLASAASSAVVGTSGAYALTATVLDADGNPVPGVSVTLVGPSAGAGVTPALATGITDANGQVMHTFAANDTAGSFHVQAVVSGVATNGDVQLTNLPDAAASIELVSGNNQLTPVNTAFANALTVRVLDQYGNPVADDAAASVSFTASTSTSGATASVTSTVTSVADGLASTPVSANGIAGNYNVTASFDTTSVSFALENTVGSVSISNIVWANSGNATSIAYDGGTHTASATVSGSTATPNFTYNGGSTLPKDAGTYHVTATIDDGNVYGTVSADLMITPTVAGSTGIALTGGTFAYNGASHAATVANPNGVAYTLSYNTTSGLPPINVGNYTATLTVTDPNYASEDITANIEITKATGQAVFNGLSATYDGTAHSVTAYILQEPTTSCQVSATGTDPYPRTNAGSSDLTANCAGSNFAATDTATLTVDPRPVQIALSGTGTFVYDTTAHTVTASITGDFTGGTAVAVVSYNPGGSTAPETVGTYSVHAVLDTASAVNYSATPADGTIIITKGETTVTINQADLQQTFGLTHAVSASASPAITGTINVTYDGDSQVPTAVGSYTVVATVDDPNYTGSADDTLVISAVPVSDVKVVMTDNVDYAQYSVDHDYFISVSNIGNQVLTNVSVKDMLPSTLDANRTTWYCIPSPGATAANCSGDHDLVDTVDLPVGGSVSYMLVSPVLHDVNLASELVINTVTATLSMSGDPTPVNNTATDQTQAVIFRNGFEAGGNGAQVRLVQVALGGAGLSASADGSLMIPLDQAPVDDGVVQTLARGTSAHGMAFQVDVLRLGGVLVARLTTRDELGDLTSRWTQVKPGTTELALGLLKTRDGARHLMLVGGKHSIELPVAAGTLKVRAVQPPTLH